MEGALGKIAVNSVLNPRQLLQVSKRGANDNSGGNSPKPPSPGPVSTKSHTVLGWIENVYTYVLALEQKRRQQPPPPRMGEEEIAGEAIRRWYLRSFGRGQLELIFVAKANHFFFRPGSLGTKSMVSLRKRCGMSSVSLSPSALCKLSWHYHVEQDVSIHYLDISLIMFCFLHLPDDTSHPHPFISILNYSKGKKVIPRVLRHLLPEQTLTLLTMLVANFESLNVCKSEVYADVQGNQEIELFMNTIVPPLLGFVSEAPFRIVVGLLALFIERNNMIWVARSKVKKEESRQTTGLVCMVFGSQLNYVYFLSLQPGLAFLTLFLSRAEILKQGQGNYPIPDDREINQWYVQPSLSHTPRSFK